MKDTKRKQWLINAMIQRRKLLREQISFNKRGGSENADASASAAKVELYSIEIELNYVKVGGNPTDETVNRLREKFSLPKNEPDAISVKPEGPPSRWKDRVDYERYCVHCDGPLTLHDRLWICLNKCDALRA